jgi:hypothetical protein
MGSSVGGTSSGGTSAALSATGGATPAGSGGAKSTGGVGTGGKASAGGGTKSTGGIANGGSSATGGAIATGGKATGGTSFTGTVAVGGATGGAATGGTATSASVGVKIQGKQLLVNGTPFRIRGVCWNPVPKGKSHPDGLDYPGLAPVDIPLMKAAHINVVRAYEPLTNTSVLDQLAAAGIYVLDSVYPYGGDAASVVTSRVNAVKNHPAVLMWVIGNEWNYNGLYVSMSAVDSQTRINEVASLIRAADASHPIATVYGEVPTSTVVNAMPNIEVWGINAYRGISFGDLFSKWSGVSSKPMFLSEFGADAYNATKAVYDPDSQAVATDALTREIAAQCTDTNANGTTLGGTIFEWADEWWKDSNGKPDVHDVGGTAPGGGPYPDATFNEEWWGIVDVDRVTRPAYDALKNVYGGGGSTDGTSAAWLAAHSRGPSR